MKKTPILAALVAALFAVSSACAAENLADRHAKLGFKCETCHAGQATPSEPPMEACTGCHQIEALLEKTKNVKPTNPHVSPHYGNTLEGVNCHIIFDDTTNFDIYTLHLHFTLP